MRQRLPHPGSLRGGATFRAQCLVGAQDDVRAPTPALTVQARPSTAARLSQRQAGRSWGIGCRAEGW